MVEFISADTVRKILKYDILTSTMTEALKKFSQKLVVQPVRAVLPVAKEGGRLLRHAIEKGRDPILCTEKTWDPGGQTRLRPAAALALEERYTIFLCLQNSGVNPNLEGLYVAGYRFLGLMPSVCEEEDVMGTKLVTFYPNNSDRYGVSTHHAIIVLFEMKTGIPKAIMDGEVITTMRTAAVSAVATKLLGPPNAEKLAILGAGVQARSHYHALSHVMQINQVSVWSRTYDNAVKCAQELGGTAFQTAQEAVQNADVIVTVTGATTPVLKAEWVKKGAHVNGACRPDWSEIDPVLMRSAVLYVDSREAALKESGDVIFSKAEIYAELGEVVLGEKEAYKDQTTVFKSLGMAIEDSMAAKLVLDLHSGKMDT